jgi:hypothetical protein
MKKKHDNIRSGFEAILILSAALLIAPATIVIAAFPSAII